MQDEATLYHGDALTIMASFVYQSIDLICVDPPYFRVKMGEAWDRQWKTEADYLSWIGTLCEQWVRILKPNGSLYCFASPEMSARVECVMRERFQVLNRIRWIKEAGWHQKTKKEELRAFLTPWEEIIFAEPYWSDETMNEESGYNRQCDALHKKVYAPIGRYIQTERERAGFTRNEVEVGLGYVSTSDPTRGTALCCRWEEGSSLPTKEAYERLQVLLNSRGGEYLRKEYEELRKEYEELRRPFSLSAKVPYTDVWNFSTVTSSPYKHVCEKPLALLEHIVTCSSRPGAVLLDCCMGSGSTGVAAVRNGRQFIGIEQDALWVSRAREWIASERRQSILPFPVKASPIQTQGGLFGADE